VVVALAEMSETLELEEKQEKVAEMPMPMVAVTH